MTMTASRNGTPHRKQLCDQIDRLDDILDGLADGLTDAVRDAVKEGTATALRQVLLELAGNPATRELLRQVVAPTSAATAESKAEAPPEPVPGKPSFLARWGTKARGVARKVATLPGRAVAAVRGLVQRIGGLKKRLNIAWQLKKALVLGVAIGIAVAVLATVSHPLASILSGVGAAATAFTVQIAVWCRNTLRQMIS